jgi:hypothetical protein
MKETTSVKVMALKWLYSDHSNRRAAAYYCLKYNIDYIWFPG